MLFFGYDLAHFNAESRKGKIKQWIDNCFNQQRYASFRVAQPKSLVGATAISKQWAHSHGNSKTLGVAN